MPKLLISGRGGEQIHEFAHREIVLGCDAACDIVVKGADVSPEHCKLQPVMGAWKIVDLESDAGTRVNGAYVNQRPLRSGDVLELGDVRLVFQDDGATAPAAAAPVGAAAGRAPGTGGGKGTRRSGGAATARGGGRAAPARPARGGRDDADDRERPARRPRRRQSNGGMTALLVVGALIVLAGGGYIVLNPKSSPNEQVFIRMQRAEQAMDWQAVLREGQAGNVNDPEFGKRIAGLLERANSQIANDVDREKLGQATQSWNNLRLWRQDDNWHNDVEYTQRLDAFLAEYGRFGGASVDIARQERALITGYADAGEPANVGDAWARLQANVKALKGNGQFGLAIQRVDEYGSAWGSKDADFAQQARLLKAALPGDADKWLGKQISMAQHKVDQGTKLQARKIMEKAAERIGIPALEERAAEALRTLMQ